MLCLVLALQSVALALVVQELVVLVLAPAPELGVLV
jgi:hypothetical protein